MAKSFVTGYQGYFNYDQETIIANTAQLSAAINCGGMALVGIKFPATFTGTAVTFEMCDTIDGTYVPVKSTTSGSALSYTIAQATYAAIDPKDFLGINFLKIKSGSTESGARTLVCSMRGF